MIYSLCAWRVTCQKALKKKEIPYSPKDELLHAQVVQNIDFQTDLIRTSPIIKGHLEKGDVKIARAIYDIHTGEVEFW